MANQEAQAESKIRAYFLIKVYEDDSIDVELNNLRQPLSDSEQLNALITAIRVHDDNQTHSPD